jgi:VWFA-related protein
MDTQMEKKGIKMTKKLITCSVFLVLVMSLINCGGGGSNDSGSPGLIIGDGTALYEFGSVAVNDSAVIQVKLTNNGTADLRVRSIGLSDSEAFSYSLSCGDLPVTITAEESCTLSLTFIPTAETEYQTDVTIDSNASGSPHSCTFTGTGEVLLPELQVDLKSVICDSGQLKAFVQVWDENGVAIADLDENNFDLIIDGGSPESPSGATYLPDPLTVDAPISVAILMDHSGSVTGVPQQVLDMEDMARQLVNNLEAADEAEIIKFDGVPQVVQAYTSDNAALIDAIITPFVRMDGLTALYDAMFKAIEDTELQNNTQRAIIVLTDGLDSDGEDPLSTHTPAQVIALAQDENIKIFTVSIGTKTNDPELRQFAEDTGGQFFKVDDTSELLTVVNDKLLAIFQNAYEIPFGPNSSDSLTVTATLPGMAPGSDSLTFEPCP